MLIAISARAVRRPEQALADQWRVATGDAARASGRPARDAAARPPLRQFRGTGNNHQPSQIEGAHV